MKDRFDNKKNTGDGRELSRGVKSAVPNGTSQGGQRPALPKENRTGSREKGENAGAAREPVEGAVIGRNAVRELLRSGREIDKIFVRKGDREGSIVVIIAEAKNAGIPVIEVEKAKLDSMSGGANHQGVVAMAAEKEYSSIEDILKIAEDRGEAPLIVIADGITDPYNLGTLIRCAEGAGAHGLIISKRRASGLTPLVTKASAGAVEHLAIAKVPNITAAIEALKEKGIWIFAAEAGGKAYYETDFSGPCAIVLGSEGEGISRLVLEKSDFVVSIPMYGKVNSFNVSTAAAVLLAEASRQHRAKK
jgi:23S rRNA (guanosine2251-2'-O)-methyltransferase